MILYPPPVRFLLLMCFIVSGQCMLPLCPLVLIEVTVLLHLRYSPMRACASIMDLLQTLGLRPHFWFPNSQFFMEWGFEPHAQPPTWRVVHWVPILVAFYDMFSVQWDYSLILVIMGDEVTLLSALNDFIISSVMNAFKYRVSCTDGKISVKIILFYLFFTVVPSNVVCYVPVGLLSLI